MRVHLDRKLFHGYLALLYWRIFNIYQQGCPDLVEGELLELVGENGIVDVEGFLLPVPTDILNPDKPFTENMRDRQRRYARELKGME